MIKWLLEKDYIIKPKKQILKNLKHSLKYYAKKCKFSCKIRSNNPDDYQIIAKYLFSKNIDFNILDNDNLMVKWGEKINVYQIYEHTWNNFFKLL